MQSLQESARQLQELIKDLPAFEVTILIKWSAEFRKVRIVRFSKSFTVLVGGDEQQFPTLDKAFEMVAEYWGDGKLLIDSLTVRVSASDYSTSNDQIYKLVRSSLTSVFPSSRLVVSNSPNFNSKIVDSFSQKLLALRQSESGVYMKQNGQLSALGLTAETSPGVGSTSGTPKCSLVVSVHELPSSYLVIHYSLPDLTSALATMDCILAGAELLPDTLIVSKEIEGSEEEIASFDDPIYQETLAFLFACVGRQNPGGTPRGDAEKCRELELRNYYHSLLTSGPDGQERWNNMSFDRMRLIDFRNWDVKIQSRGFLHLGPIDFSGTNFSTSIMSQAYASQTKLTDCSFEDCDLSHSTFDRCTVNGANFSGANMQYCTFEDSDLSNTNFKNAHVKGMQFINCNLRGVDITAFDAAKAKSFKKCQYDETTVLPLSSDFLKFLKQLVWKGNGPDPYKTRLKDVQNNRDLTKLDFDGFMKMIKEFYDSERVSKTVAMLKKEKFELFSEQDTSGVYGIVKSQTDPDLVYACKLGVDGTFNCCTQNLNSCGGLRGALCKHILVLVIGLVKSGTLNPSEAARRVLASNSHKPSKADKEAMTSVFFKYKGAESGEIDWRPTETTPEDFYSY